MVLDSGVAPVCAEIRALLAERGLTHREVEDRAGFTSKYLSKLLTGRVRITVEHIVRVLEAVKCDPADFWGRVTVRYREASLPLDDEQMDALIRRVIPTVETAVREFLAGQARGDGGEG